MRIWFLVFFTLISQAQQQPSVAVTVKPLKEVLIERRLTANAEVKALNAAQLSSELTATVSQIHADLGDKVKKGDLLVSLDKIDVNLQLDQTKAHVQAAKARLTQAELRLKRANELKQGQYVSADDLLARETDVAVYKADLSRLKAASRSALRQVDKTKITAPFDGIITVRQAQLGQLLVMNSPVVTLVQTTNKQVYADIPSHLAKQLKHADRMMFVNKDIESRVELIQLSRVIGQQSGLQSARFKPLNKEVLIGQTGQLVWYLKGQLLSADLLVKRNGKLGVFIFEQGTAKFMPLPNSQEGRPTPIDSSPNWQVIIGGRERLQDGQAITLK